MTLEAAPAEVRKEIRRQRRFPSTLGLAIVAASVAALLAAAPAAAFDSKGHNVIEALAYRTLVEGRDGQPPRPDVLRDLLNDGALEPPTCFGAPSPRSRLCVDADHENPLLLWPQPRTDRPDAFFRRQFSDPGQCFHYMAMLADAQSDPFPGTGIPRALATRAVVRCNDLLDNLLRQVVVDGGPGVRKSGNGLYEMMHAVADSFSRAHTERDGSGDVDYLRVWKPIEKLVKLPTERSKGIPPAVFHVWDDHRDKTYVTEGEPGRCEKRADQPYDVPYECLSAEGDRARRALAELIVLVRDLRLAQQGATPGTDTHPERADVWQAYRTKWFTAVHLCSGAECDERQQADVEPGRYSLLGPFLRTNPTAHYSELGVEGNVLKFSEAFNPFVYSVVASAAWRRYRDGSDSGVFGLGIGLTLPVGFKTAIGFTPAAVRMVAGGTHSGPEFVSRLLRFDVRIGDDLFVTVDGPVEVNWLEPRAEWSIAAGVTWALRSFRMAGGPIVEQHSERADRHDDGWTPPAAPYGRLEGRATTLRLLTTFTVDGTPDTAVEGQKYGLAALGAELAWDRDAWGGKFEWVPAASLTVGTRATSGDSAYLTGALGASVRWYFARPLGLSFTPVRIEGGPKVRGNSEADASPGVHGGAGSQYYLQAGSRLGLALNTGIFDLVVEGPTLAWTSTPYAGKEIFSVRLGIQLN